MSEHMLNLINILPIKVFDKILQYLHFDDFLNLKQVSKDTYYLIESSIVTRTRFTRKISTGIEMQKLMQKKFAIKKLKLLPHKKCEITIILNHMKNIIYYRNLKKYFETCGKFMKKLQIKIERKKTKKFYKKGNNANFLPILFLPNLEELIIEDNYVLEYNVIYVKSDVDIFRNLRTLKRLTIQTKMDYLNTLYFENNIGRNSIVKNEIYKVYNSLINNNEDLEYLKLKGNLNKETVISIFKNLYSTQKSIKTIDLKLCNVPNEIWQTGIKTDLLKLKDCRFNKTINLNSCKSFVQLNIDCTLLNLILRTNLLDLRFLTITMKRNYSTISMSKIFLYAPNLKILKINALSSTFLEPVKIQIATAKLKNLQLSKNISHLLVVPFVDCSFSDKTSFDEIEIFLDRCNHIQFLSFLSYFQWNDYQNRDENFFDFSLSLLISKIIRRRPGLIPQILDQGRMIRVQLFNTWKIWKNTTWMFLI